MWVTIRRRATLQHVSDEHLIARKARKGQQIGKVMSRGAHKRTPLQIFVFARRLANEHHAGGGVAKPRHHIRAAFAQSAPATLVNNAFDIGQKLGGILAFLRLHRCKMTVHYSHGASPSLARVNLRHAQAERAAQLMRNGSDLFRHVVD